MRLMSVYYITHQRKDKDGVITDLYTRKDSSAGSGESMTKARLITLLKPLGTNIAKTYNNGLSEDVRVIDGKYLRTDANNTKADNLGNLPSF